MNGYRRGSLPRANGGSKTGRQPMEAFLSLYMVPKAAFLRWRQGKGQAAPVLAKAESLPDSGRIPGVRTDPRKRDFPIAGMIERGRG